MYLNKDKVLSYLHKEIEICQSMVNLCLDDERVGPADRYYSKLIQLNEMLCLVNDGDFDDDFIKSLQPPEVMDEAIKIYNKGDR